MNNVINFDNRKLIEDRYLRAKDLKKLFVGLSPSTVTKWVKLGVLKPYKILGSNFFAESDIVKLLHEAKYGGN